MHLPAGFLLQAEEEEAVQAVTEALTIRILEMEEEAMLSPHLWAMVVRVRQDANQDQAAASKAVLVRFMAPEAAVEDIQAEAAVGDSRTLLPAVMVVRAGS